MDIGIIGGGGAGLTAAWLLSEQHRVTLFEAQERLGGHAHTVNVEIGGSAVPIDAGLDFFHRGIWPTFYRLLEILGAPVRRYQATTTFHTTDNRLVIPLPLMRDGRMNWSLLRPSTLSTVRQLGQVLRKARPLVEAGDASVTLEEFTENLRLSREFKEKVFYPMMLAGWCVEMEEFKQFAAYNVMKYVVLRETQGLSQFSTEVVGGMAAYIDRLAAAVRAKTLRSTSIRSLTRTANRYRVEDSAGAVHEFDHLIIATNAREARGILSPLREAEELTRALGGFTYFKGAIALHGDRRLMPSDEKRWSVINIRHDGVHSAMTVWKPWKSATARVFKSWVTYEPRLPEPLYFTATYDHLKVDLNHFRSQRALAPLQGRNNLWVAGAYTHDVDSHESAIVSAVRIARSLAPESANMRRLIAREL